MTFQGNLEVRPFEVAVPEEAIAEFKLLLRLSKIGPSTFENTNKTDTSYGVSRAWIEKAKDHWLNVHDW